MSRLFAALYDRVLAPSEEAGLADMRAALVGRAHGEVLELGAGTGLNLPHYDPERVTRVVAVEPDRHMAAHLRRRPARVAVEVVEGFAGALPFPEASFDSAVATLVLCTVPDPAGALRDLARVLRPGGRLLVLEHVRSEDPGTARWQDRLERPWSWVAGGCHPNRDTAALLRASGLELEELDATRLPKAAALIRPAVVATAVRPGAPASGPV